MQDKPIELNLESMDAIFIPFNKDKSVEVEKNYFSI